jgi:hypothetical protein
VKLLSIAQTDENPSDCLREAQVHATLALTAATAAAFAAAYFGEEGRRGLERDWAALL